MESLQGVLTSDANTVRLTFNTLACYVHLSRLRWALINTKACPDGTLDICYKVHLSMPC